MRVETTYDAAAIGAKLVDLPKWTYSADALERVFRTANFRASLMVVMAVGHLCEVAWHHPDILVGFDRVTVRLSTHSANGITDKDFDLAHKIESVVAWRPALEDNALDGLPANPKYAYVEYD